MTLANNNSLTNPTKRGRGRPPIAKPAQPVVRRNNPPSSSYKKIATTFAVCTILLIIIILYFSLSKAKITLIPNTEKIDHSLEIKITNNVPESRIDYLPGFIVTQEFEETKNWPVNQGEKQEAKASGVVTIINTHSEEQTLVKTTRLLSPDNVLFRLQKTVVVPANGQIDAPIEADQAGSSGNLEPTRFTIPGLNEFLKKKIYAENKSAISGGIVMIGTLSQDQIDQAAEKFNDEIFKNKINDLPTPDEVKNSDKTFEKIDLNKPISHSTSQKLGEKMDSFDLTTKIALARIWFDKQQIIEVTKNSLKQEIGPNRELTNYDMDNFKYYLKNFDWETKTATLEVSLPAWATSQVDLEKIQKSDLKGMNQEALQIYFEPMDEIQEIKIRFWPFWVKTIPTLEDHIEIEVKQ